MKAIAFYTTLSMLMLLSISAFAQSDAILDHYIKLGLNQNLSIQQQKYELEKSEQDLRNARGSLLPTVDLNARYTRANGGRSFQMPLGDLMNPVYNTLNTIVGEGSFPNIENQELNFNRTTDIDTRISIRQPIYDSRLMIQNKIQKDMMALVGEDLTISKRDVIFDVKQSYYTYLKALKLNELLAQTKQLVSENLRVSQVLYANDKVTEDAVWRSKTEIRKVDFQIAEANKHYQISKKYFNQLLNRDMDDSIYVDNFEEDLVMKDLSEDVSFLNREELEKLLITKNIVHHQGKIASSNNLPNFYLAFDAGFQGTKYEFSSESDYYMASAVVSWNLFSGFKNKSQKQKAEIEQKRLESQYFDIRNKLQLEVEDSRLEFEKSAKNHQTAEAAQIEATSNYKIVSRKYEEGLASQLELIDARTFMTNAAIENIIAKYDVLISRAAYERAIAGYEIK